MNEFYIPGPSEKIFMRQWACPDPQAVIVLVHGMGTHSGRYTRTAAFMNRENLCVVGYDQPGHGRSAGKRGHVKTYEQLLDSLQAVIDFVKQKYPQLPVFIYGHSMGGNVVVNYVLRRKPELAGVIISSPWFRLAFNPPFFKMMMAKLVVKIFPGLQQRSALNVNYISHDRDVLKEYEEDPLVHNYITPSFFLGTARAGLWALKNAAQFNLPIYLFHGTDDHITQFSATREFADAAPYAFFRQWDGCYHEVHNEWVREELYKSIIDFIAQQLRRAA